MNMKRVAFYTNMPSPYRVDFFNLLGKYCDLYVFFEMNKSSTRDDSWQSYDFKNFKAIFLKGYHYSGEAAFCPSIIKEYKKIKPEINFVCNFSSLTGIKLVNYFVKHNISYFIEGDGAFNRKDKLLIKKAIKNKVFSHADKLFYTSDEHLEYLLSHKADINKTIRYPFSSLFKNEICNPNDVFPNKKSFKERIGIQNRFTIISVGRFLKLKNFDLLIKVFKEFEDRCQLLLVGGKETEEYKKIIMENNIRNISFIDFLNKKELFMYLKASDLFVFTSLLDVWGLVINEAMANSLPIISSDGALGAVELSKNNSGIILYKAGSKEELVNMLDKIINSSENTLKKMSNSNYIKIQEYTLEKMCEAHIKYIC